MNKNTCARQPTPADFLSISHFKAGDKVILTGPIPRDKRLYQKLPKIGRLYCIESVCFASTIDSQTLILGLTIVGLNNVDAETGRPTAFNAKHFVRVEDIQNYNAAVNYRLKQSKGRGPN